MAGCGLVFAGVAAVAAQLAESSRTAVGIACSVLAATYALRAIGDVQSALHALTWLSPQGWANHVQPYGENNFAVVGLFVLATVAILLVAGALLDRRDLGLALFPARLGPATNPSLRRPESLAIRLQRGSFIGWVVGMAALGAVTGGVASTSSDLLTGNPQLAELMARIGGAGAITDVLLSTMGVLAGLIVGGYAISSALRMSSEESADRVGPVLATAVSRPRWMAGHLLVRRARTSRSAGRRRRHRWPAERRPGRRHDQRLRRRTRCDARPGACNVGTRRVGGRVYGWLPRFTSLAWAALVLALLLGQLGQLLQLPQWLMDLSPYTHLPQVPTAEMRWTPVILLVLVAAGLIGIGIAGFKRRDVN